MALWSGDNLPRLNWDTWSQFMVNVTPTPTALFWMTVYILRLTVPQNKPVLLQG